MKHAAPRKPRKYDAAVAVVVAFCLSMAVFGIALLAALAGGRETLGGSEEVSGVHGVSRSAWVLLHDERRLQGLLSVTIDTAKLTVDAVVYPPETEVTDGTMVTTAATVFAERGERVVDLIAEDETVVLSLGGAAMLIRELSGNLPLTLPRAVGEIPRGAVTLTPLQAAAVLRFEDYGGCVAKATVTAELARSFFERLLRRLGDTERAFGCLTEASESRLSVAQFAAVRDEWEALAAAEAVCTARVAAGYTTGSPVRYVVTE